MRERVKLPARIQALIVEVAERHGVLVSEVVTRRGSARNTQVKRIIVRRLHAEGFSDGAIGRFLGMDHSSVYYLRTRMAANRAVASQASVPIPCPDLSGEWAI